MLKLATAFLLVTISVTAALQGQTLPVAPQENPTAVRQAIAAETEKLKSESATLDVKKIEKMERQAPQGKNWNKRDKLLIVSLIAGLAVLAVVLALTTKRCVKRSPEGCDFVNDLNCKCLEFAE